MLLLEERSDFKQLVSRSQEVVKQYYLTDLLINAYDESGDTLGPRAYLQAIQGGKEPGPAVPGKGCAEPGRQPGGIHTEKQPA